MFENLTLIQLMAKGGYIMILLAFFSILSLAVILERGWRFFAFRRRMRHFYNEFSHLRCDDGTGLLEDVCNSNPSPLTNIVRAGIAKPVGEKEDVADAMELAARHEIAGLERFLGILGTIGNTAPFIGLFGTVLGIIRAFHDLAGAQGAGPSVVADGIAEALVATAAGLFVAIPAVIAYNYFTRMISSYSLEIESKSRAVIDMLLELRSSSKKV